MKKIISFFLAVAMVMAVCSVSANTLFSDVSQDHWAKASIERLVSDGTVSGYEDGSFKPYGTVTRAEFVKMLGKSAVRHDADFADVSANHWAYDYIMYSGLSGDDDGNFNPDTPITRGQVAQLLYTRYANDAVAIAPYAVSAQLENRNVSAWVYNAGLMIGDDMINLRLEDTLTRAEAAVLIVRAKELDPAKKRNFIDNFSDEAYKNIYEGSNIFDTPYDANGNITYEEIATAALRYQYKDRTPALGQYYFEPKYDGKAAIYWDIMCTYALDEKGYGATYETAQKSVTVEDAIAMLTLAVRNNPHFDSSFVKGDSDIYPEVEISLPNSNFSKNLRYAYDFGISLYQDAVINPKRLITKKELSCILMQYNLTFGAHIALYTSSTQAGAFPLTVRPDSSSYPANSNLFAFTANEIPNKVYEAPIGIGKDVKAQPKQYVNTISHHTNMHFSPFMDIAINAEENGAEVGITMYPSVAVKIAKKGGLYRIKLDVIGTDGLKMLSDVIPLGAGVQDIPLTPGESLYLDVAANQQATSAYLDYTRFTVENVIF